MTREELLKKLRELQTLSEDDEEIAHADADYALLEYIGDAEVSAAFSKIKRWYA